MLRFQRLFVVLSCCLINSFSACTHTHRHFSLGGPDHVDYGGYNQQKQVGYFKIVVILSMGELNDNQQSYVRYKSKEFIRMYGDFLELGTPSCHRSYWYCLFLKNENQWWTGVPQFSEAAKYGFIQLDGTHVYTLNVRKITGWSSFPVLSFFGCPLFLGEPMSCSLCATG